MQRNVKQRCIQCIIANAPHTSVLSRKKVYIDVQKQKCCEKGLTNSTDSLDCLLIPLRISVFHFLCFSTF